MWNDGFIAVDWGTTNRRAYSIDTAGVVVDQMEDDRGVSSLTVGSFPNAVAEIRQRMGERPLLLAGMVGSNRGWREAPYVPCPARLGDLVARLEWVETGRVAIVPGLSIVEGETGDVMRGEEVQVFGLLGQLRESKPHTICHPGTHTKWIALQEDAIAGFRTVMTGEIFALLRKHSILAPLLKADPAVGPSFLRGVERGFAHGELSAELFAVRARVLLSLMEESEAASYASGLLIGCDLRAGLSMHSGGEIVVLGTPTLTRLYAQALRHCGQMAREADGATAFVAGMVAIKEKLG